MVKRSESSPSGQPFLVPGLLNADLSKSSNFFVPEASSARVERERIIPFDRVGSS